MLLVTSGHDESWIVGKNTDKRKHSLEFTAIYKSLVSVDVVDDMKRGVIMTTTSLLAYRKVFLFVFLDWKISSENCRQNLVRKFVRQFL